MWNAMSMKEAVKQWEAHNKQKISTATEIKLIGICPSLDKMDTIMLSFVNCEKLSLSSNAIERIANLGNMKHLKILSLGRNLIKSIAGIEAVADTLEELWISYNQIDKLKGIGVMKKLRVLSMSNNHVREWCEFMRLAELPSLKELVFLGNPLEERCSSEGIWRSEVARRLPCLGKLDGVQCTEAEVNLADTQTELQKTEADDDDNQTSKFDVTEDTVEEKEAGEEQDGEEEESGEDGEDETEGDESEEGEKEGKSDKQDDGQSAEKEENPKDSISKNPPTNQPAVETIHEEVPKQEEEDRC